MTVRILVGDVREQLKTLADDSVDCVVTSPPYWCLRDYGVEGQLGMERTLGEHVEVMTTVFRDVKRVLKPTFGGAGTTGLVSDRLKRNAVLIELNPAYAEIAERRIKGDCPMFTSVGKFGEVAAE